MDKDLINQWSVILCKAICKAVANGYRGTYYKMDLSHCKAAINVLIDDEPFFYNIIFDPEFARALCHDRDSSFIAYKHSIFKTNTMLAYHHYLANLALMETYEDKFRYLEGFIQ